MGHRESIYVSTRTPFESPPSPNSTIDAITVDIRIFYPPNATFDDVNRAWDQAWVQADVQVTGLMNHE